MGIEIFQKLYERNEKITVLTAYDYPTARLLSQGAIDAILLGDSLGMVIQGQPNTRSVKLDHMLYHLQCVKRGAPDLPLIVDLPFGSDATPEEALDAAKKLLSTGAHGVKLEGSKIDVITALVKAQIPVMGHLGLLPQTAEKYSVQGKTEESQIRMIKQAQDLQEAGCFSIVLECIPSSLGRKITEVLNIPIIGIGAGSDTDGQVLVFHDLMGFLPDLKPRFVPKLPLLYDVMLERVKQWGKETKTGQYPSQEEQYR